jgi:hypothetical protein
MAKAFKGHTKEGIGMGSSRADVISAFGEPDETVRIDPAQEQLRYPLLKLSLSLNQGQVVHIGVEL